MSKSKIVNSTWYNLMTGEPIGIVELLTEEGKTKFYIGVGLGTDQEKDEKLIAEWGTPFYPEVFMKREKKNV